MHKYFEIKYSRTFSSKHNLTGSGLPKSVTVSCASLLPYIFLMVQMRQIFIFCFQLVMLSPNYFVCFIALLVHFLSKTF